MTPVKAIRVGLGAYKNILFGSDDFQTADFDF